MPSIRLAQSDGDRQLLIAEGLYRFAPPWWRPVTAVSLVAFLDWVFEGKAVPHYARLPQGLPRRQPAWIWTALQYVQAEDTQIVDDDRRQRLLNLQKQRRRELIDERNMVTRAKALRDATVVEDASRVICQGDGTGVLP